MHFHFNKADGVNRQKAVDTNRPTSVTKPMFITLKQRPQAHYCARNAMASSNSMTLRSRTESANRKERQSQSRSQSNNSTVRSLRDILWRSASVELDALVFMRSCAPLRNTPLLQSERTFSLPPRRAHDKRYTLLLDLDETLVHCSTESTKAFDALFSVSFGGLSHRVWARKRPFLEEFLKAVSSAKQFEVVLFTASQKSYAS